MVMEFPSPPGLILKRYFSFSELSVVVNMFDTELQFETSSSGLL